MTDMFFQQPIELISDEQLVRLPIQDLLSACSSTPEFNELCKRREIWTARIQNEYPEVNIADVRDPRDFYLRQKLFGGGIYVHYIDYGSISHLDINSQRSYELENLDVLTQQVEPEIIEYNNLFIRSQEIAEMLRPSDKDYIIIYSRPRSDNKVELSIIGYQINDYVALLPGPAEKITLVDIIYVLPDSDIISMLRKLKQLEDAISSNQPFVRIDGRRYSMRSLALQIKDTFDELEGLAPLLKYHELANTAFYQREVDYLASRRLLRIRSPQIPKLSNTDEKVDKIALLNLVMSSVTHLTFRTASHLTPVFGFATYDDFKSFQENYINSMDDDQLRFMRVVIKGLLPITETTEGKPQEGLVFNSYGKIVLT